MIIFKKCCFKDYSIFNITFYICTKLELFEATCIGTLNV